MAGESRFQLSASNDKFESVTDRRFISVKWQKTGRSACGIRLYSPGANEARTQVFAQTFDEILP